MNKFDVEKIIVDKMKLCELRHFFLHVFNRGYDCATIGIHSCPYQISIAYCLFLIFVSAAYIL